MYTRSRAYRDLRIGVDGMLHHVIDAGAEALDQP
jgi:hypothetical protein